jgi:hypothetical protein
MNDVWGKPQIYKEIPFYPLKIYQQKQYDIISRYLTIFHQQYQDKKIARASYLKFLLLILQSLPEFESVDIYLTLRKLLRFITRSKNVDILFNVKDEMDLESYSFFIYINGIKLNETDFENVRELILEQNYINFDHIQQFDSTLEENLLIIYKGKTITMPEYIFSFSAKMQILPEDIKNKYTIYQFYNTIQRLQLIEDYKTFKALESAGFIKMQKGEIPHWLTHVPKKGRYDDILIPKETFIKDSEIMKVSTPK